MAKPRLFNMDLHISVIEDFDNLFKDRFDIVKWTLSGHAWVLGKQTQQPKHINAETWKNLDKKMIDDFCHEYDSFLRNFDGFICGHPNSFCLIFERYNKPIILINTCRYDMPFCWSLNTNMIQEYHNCLKRLNNQQKLILVSNNLFDREYFRIGTGLRPSHIPSLCLYTGIDYTPKRDEYLLFYGSGNIPPPVHPLIMSKERAFSGRPYQWSAIGEFQGVIYFSYEISTMSMFEHFSAGIPMFFPSKKFYQDHPTCGFISFGAYWGSNTPKYKQESLVLANREKWISLSDWESTFGKWGDNIFFFDTYDQLYKMLESKKGKLIKGNRKKYLDKAIERWNSTLDRFFPK